MNYHSYKHCDAESKWSILNGKLGGNCQRFTVLSGFKQLFPVKFSVTEEYKAAPSSFFFYAVAKRNLGNTFLNKSLETRYLGQTASHTVYTYASSLLLATLSLPISRVRLQDASLSQSIA